VIDPAGATLNDVVTRAQAALAANLVGAFSIAAVMNAIGTPLPVVGATPAQQVPALVGSLLSSSASMFAASTTSPVARTARSLR
jgi:hypothetical protein